MSLNDVEVSCKICPPELTGALGVAFMVLINALVQKKSLIESKGAYPDDYGAQLLKDSDKTHSFDMVIVGGGAAGCLLANRLSQITTWTILLLEVGDYPSASSNVPALFLEMKGTREDWSFETETEKNACRGLRGGRCKIIRGKVLGGTSTINNMHYARASRDDFRNWPSVEDKWSEALINEHYEQIEGYKGESEKTIKYGRNGDLPLDDLGEQDDIKDLIYAAAKNLSQSGYTEVLGTKKEGTRWNYAKAFLNPIRKRKNLFVAKNAFVAKILFAQGSDRKVQGVNVQIGSKEILVKVQKEVVVTAGAINSAKLLMISGVGPKDMLKRLNIKPLVDCDVGQNLQDKMAALIFVGIDDDGRDSKEDLMEAAYSFVIHGEGSFTHTNINDLVGFINTKSEPTPWPNVAIYHYFFQKSDHVLEKYLANLDFDTAIVRSILGHNQNQSLLLFMPAVIKPKSRGEIVLRTNNPFDAPIIKGNYLLDPDNEDFQDLLSGVNYVMQLITAEPLAARSARFLNIDMKNCRNLKYCNVPYLRCVVQNMAVPLSEVIGTARINVVVDEDLKVRGVGNLRVVDGSVLPGHVTGSLDATVAMMASRISVQIKEDWRHN